MKAEKSVKVVTSYDDIAVPEGINDEALKAAQVTFCSFDELKDTSIKLNLFIENTVQMAQEGNDEEWRMQYDALENLRVLNKYHP